MANPMQTRPTTLLDEFQEQLNRIFGPGTGGPLDESHVVTGQWSPLVDIKESVDRYVLYADVPGVDPASIDVTMENGMLTIRGERAVPATEEAERWSRVERRYGSFHRRFSLPEGVDPERVEAHCRNGVLEIAIPKAEKAQPRRISVET